MDCTRLFSKTTLTRQLKGTSSALLLCVLCLLVSGCISESSDDDNPFNVSSFSLKGSKEPFSSTVFSAPETITASSPSTFQQLDYQGQLPRYVYDRRTDEFTTKDMYVYTVTYTDGYSLEALINTEFGSETNARSEAVRYSTVVGQLPTALHSGIEALWIHKGEEFWGSTDNALYIHTGMAANYDEAGILEETLAHESSHLSLDSDNKNTDAWRVAQTSDDNFISTHARINQDREDFTESFIIWMALRYAGDTISAETRELAEQAIPARLSYLDAQDFNMLPLTP